MTKKSKKSKKKAKKPRLGRARVVPKRGGEPKGARKKRKGITKVSKTTAPMDAGVRFAAATSAVAEVVAEKGCLPYPEAEALVYNCGSPEADGVPSSTPLGNLFSGQRLASFCQCVADGVPVSASKVPCSASKTLQDVIDAIACK
jgi:hypothetical protein